MSMQFSASTPSWTSFSPDKAFKAPLGAASPLWVAYMGAASAGVAFWWMSRWMLPTNLEALFGAKAEVKLLEVQAAVAQPVIEAVHEAPVVAEAVVEPVAEVVEAVAAPVEVPAAPVEAVAAPVEAAAAVVEDAVKPAPAKAAPAKAAPAAAAKPANGLSPTAKALIARRKAASAKASKTA